VTAPPTGGNAGILCASTNAAGLNNGALILYGKAIRIGPSMTNVNFSTAAVSVATPTATNHVATKAYVDAAVIDTYLGARTDLGTTNAITWLPSKYVAKWSPDSAATFDMSDDLTYKRATYTLWVYSTNAISWDANIGVQNSITASGTNVWVLQPADSSTNWTAVGRSF